MHSAIINIIAVGAGSCIGGVLRYLLSKLIQTSTAGAFPWGTLAVNLIGCLVIGIIYGLLDRGLTLSPAMKLFLTVGFCGGFTTFSTFMHENYLLFGGGSLLPFIVYAAASFIFGLALVYGGYQLAGVMR